MARDYMYISNIVKRVILCGSVFSNLKQNYRLKDEQNAWEANVLLHELSHDYKISYTSFLQGVNLPKYITSFFYWYGNSGTFK